MAVRHHIRILVIDEDSSVQKTIQSQLEERGFQPRVFTDPREGLDVANKESFQIAVVSLGLSGIDGMDVIEKLKSIDGRMSVIATTADPDLETARQAMRRGGCDYIEKPLGSDELAESIERSCRKLGLIYTEEDDLNRLIGQRIRTERLAQNLTLRQLSDRTELTTSQLSQVELGKNAASIWALARISNSLGRLMSEMLTGL